MPATILKLNSQPQPIEVAETVEHDFQRLLQQPKSQVVPPPLPVPTLSPDWKSGIVDRLAELMVIKTVDENKMTLGDLQEFILLLEIIVKIGEGLKLESEIRKASTGSYNFIFNKRVIITESNREAFLQKVEKFINGFPLKGSFQLNDLRQKLQKPQVIQHVRNCLS
jgi:hypothetical protein